MEDNFLRYPAQDSRVIPGFVVPFSEDLDVLPANDSGNFQPRIVMHTKHGNFTHYWGAFPDGTWREFCCQIGDLPFLEGVRGLSGGQAWSGMELVAYRPIVDFGWETGGTFDLYPGGDPSGVAAGDLLCILVTSADGSTPVTNTITSASYTWTLQAQEEGAATNSSYTSFWTAPVVTDPDGTEQASVSWGGGFANVGGLVIFRLRCTLGIASSPLVQEGHTSFSDSARHVVMGLSPFSDANNIGLMLAPADASVWDFTTPPVIDLTEITTEYLVIAAADLTSIDLNDTRGSFYAGESQAFIAVELANAGPGTYPFNLEWGYSTDDVEEGDILVLIIEDYVDSGTAPEGTPTLSGFTFTQLGTHEASTSEIAGSHRLSIFTSVIPAGFDQAVAHNGNIDFGEVVSFVSYASGVIRGVDTPTGLTFSDGDSDSPSVTFSSTDADYTLAFLGSPEPYTVTAQSLQETRVGSIVDTELQAPRTQWSASAVTDPNWTLDTVVDWIAAAFTFTKSGQPSVVVGDDIGNPITLDNPSLPYDYTLASSDVVQLTIQDRESTLGGVIAQSLWFKIVNLPAGDYQVDVSASDFFAISAVFSGDGFDLLVFVNTDTWTADGTSTYWVQTGTFNTGTTGILRVEISAV